MTLGRHFALSLEDEAKLHSCRERKRPEWIGNDLEERYVEPWICDTDKAWDAIHRAFNNSLLDYKPRSPLAGVILGGKPMYSGTEYIISFKSEAFVSDIALALKVITLDGFRSAYFQINPEEYGQPLSEDDFEYSWEWLQALQPFYKNASENKRSVIFTASQ